MRISALCLLAASLVPPGMAAEVEFQYELVPENAAASPLKGFEMGPATLFVRLKERGHVYIMNGDSAGTYRMAYPTGRPATEVQSVELPPVRLVHGTGGPGVQRVYLIVSREPVPELEQAARQGAEVSEALPLAVRNRAAGEGTYSREQKGNLTKIKLTTTGKPTAVEEISLLRGPGGPAAK